MKGVLIMVKYIYTDGACSTNGDWSGGYGVVVTNEDSSIIYYAAAKYTDKTTNNREELKAMIHALDIVNDDDEYIIASDSAYVVNTCNDWIWRWSKNGWMNSKKVTVENIDLIKILYNYLTTKFSKCQIVKVSGHNDVVGNEIADSLATNNMKKFNDIIEKNGIKITNKES